MGKDYLFIRKDTGVLIKLRHNDIIYIKANGDYVEIFTPDTRHVIHYSLYAMSQVLPRETFFRCHRSYIVNLDKVESVEGGTAFMENDHIAWLGDHYRQEFLKKINFISRIQRGGTEKVYRFMNIDLHPGDKEIALADDIVYVSDLYKQMDLMCPCGCKEMITLNMDPEKGGVGCWKLDGDSIEEPIYNEKCNTEFSITCGVAEVETKKEEA